MRNLIIRTASSMLPNKELKSNLGDMIRCTILISCLDDYIWLTDEKGFNLLKFFIPKEKLILINEFFKLENEEFNIYNLDNYIFNEKILKLKGKWHGFILKSGKLKPENEKIEITEAYFDRKTNISWQQSLIEGLGFIWKEQDYLIPKISLKVSYDIGFNYNVHAEWISKKWPMEYFKELENLLKKDYTISYQQGLDNMEEYIKWIASCKLIITPDTLALHLASALRKKVILIHGPTENHEYSYGRVLTLTPKIRECLPCHEKICRFNKTCVEEITPMMVKEGVMRMMK